MRIIRLFNKQLMDDNNKYVIDTLDIFREYRQRINSGKISIIKERLGKIAMSDEYKDYLDTTDINGITLLIYASVYSKKLNLENIVKLLIEAGANLNLQEKNGWTALMSASRNSTKSTENTVKMLIDAGCDLNLQDNDGWTALMLASRYSTKSTENTVKMLIDAGANLDLQNDNGWTAVMSSSANSASESTERTVKMLIDAGCNLDIQDASGWTALMRSVGYSGNTSTINTVRILIDGDCNLDLQNSHGFTALMVVSLIERNRSDLIKILVRAGCNPFILNNDKKTAYDILSEKNTFNEELSKIFSRKLKCRRSIYIDNTCIVCMENPANLMMNPCGHCKICKSCYDSTNKDHCVVCRSDIVNTTLVVRS